MASCIMRGLGVIAAGVVFALSTAPPAAAAIGAMSRSLEIDDSEASNGTCLVEVTGQVNVPPAEGRDLLDRGYKIVVRLWGDDPASDDLLGGAWYLSKSDGRLKLWTLGTTGLRFGLSTRVSASKLNEDLFIPGIPGEYGDDEIYAGVRLVNPSGWTVRAGETKRQTRWFNEGSNPCDTTPDD